MYIFIFYLNINICVYILYKYFKQILFYTLLEYIIYCIYVNMHVCVWMYGFKYKYTLYSINKTCFNKLNMGQYA